MQDSLSIKIEEYIFGNRAGMGPISITSTLGKEDRVFLYNMIETFQGITVWQTDKWALSWCFLPSGKVVVTSIFPDSDISGRSTVFGHSLILNIADYEKIKYNPFVLQKKQLFSKNKDLPKKLSPKSISVSVSELDNIFRETLQKAPAGFEKVLCTLLLGKKSVIGTKIPSNDLFHSVVCALPPGARKQFTFSTLEVQLIKGGRKKSREQSRKIHFYAISESELRKHKQFYGANGYVFKDGNLVPFKTLNDKIKPGWHRRLCKTIIDILNSDLDLNDCYNQIEKENGKYLSQEEFTNELFLSTKPEYAAYSAEQLKGLKSRYERDPFEFFCMCINSLRKQQSVSEWSQTHEFIEEVIKGKQDLTYWNYLLSAYKKLINENYDFIPFILKIGNQLQYNKDYYNEFSKVIVPLVIKRISDDSKKPHTIIEDFSDAIIALSNSSLGNLRDVKVLVENILRLKFGTATDEHINEYVPILYRFNDVGLFFHLIDTIDNQSEPGKNICLADCIKIILNFLLEKQQKDCDEFVVQIAKKYKHRLSKKELDSIAERYIECICSGSPSKRIIEKIDLFGIGEIFSGRSDTAIARIAEKKNIQDAIKVCDIFDFDKGFTIIREKNKIDSDELKFLIKFLRMAIQEDQRENKERNHDLFLWVKRLNINTFANLINKEDKEFLRRNFEIYFLASEIKKTSYSEGNSDQTDEKRNIFSFGFIIILLSIVGVIFGTVLFFSMDFPGINNFVSNTMQAEIESALSKKPDKGRLNSSTYPKEAKIEYKGNDIALLPVKEINTKGWLKVEAIPPGARVQILKIKKRYKHGIELEPREYAIKVTHKGYKARSEIVSIEKGKTKEIKVVLDPIREKIVPATLNVNAKPAESIIIVRDVKDAEKQYSKSKKGMNLAFGKYKVSEVKQYKKETLSRKNNDEIKQKDHNKNIRGETKIKQQSFDKFLNDDNVVGEKIFSDSDAHKATTKNIQYNKDKIDDGKKNKHDNSKKENPDSAEISSETKYKKNIKEGLHEKSKELIKSKYKLIIKQAKGYGDSVNLGERNIKDARLTEEDLEKIWKAGIFENGGEIQFYKRDENGDDFSIGRPKKLNYGKIEIINIGDFQHFPWMNNKPVLNWNYSAKVKPDKFILYWRLNKRREEFKIDPKNRRIDLIKLLQKAGKKELLNTEKTTKIWISAIKNEKPLFWSKPKTFKKYSGNLFIYQNNKNIVTFKNRTSFELTRRDLENLWLKGVNNKSKIKMKLEKATKNQEITYGNFFIDYQLENNLIKLRFLEEKNNPIACRQKDVIITQETTEFRRKSKDVKINFYEKWIEEDNGILFNENGKLKGDIKITVQCIKEMNGKKGELFRTSKNIRP